MFLNCFVGYVSWYLTTQPRGRAENTQTLLISALAEALQSAQSAAENGWNSSREEEMCLQIPLHSPFCDVIFYFFVHFACSFISLWAIRLIKSDLFHIFVFNQSVVCDYMWVRVLSVGHLQILPGLPLFHCLMQVWIKSLQISGISCFAMF